MKSFCSKETHAVQGVHEWLRAKFKTVEIELQPAGVWLVENLRVMTGRACTLYTAHWNEYALLLGYIDQLISLIRQHQPDVGLMIVISPDFLLAGVIVVQTGEVMSNDKPQSVYAFTRGAAAQKVLGEVYLGVPKREIGVGVRGKGMQVSIPFSLCPLPFNLSEGLLGEEYEK